MNRASAERDVGVSERMPPGTAAATLSAAAAAAAAAPPSPALPSVGPSNRPRVTPVAPTAARTIPPHVAKLLPQAYARAVAANPARRTASAPLPAEAQRSHAAPAAASTSAADASQRAAVASPASQPHAHRGGRAAESSPVRLQRVRERRKELVQQILARVSTHPTAKAWNTLSPLEQLLPSPPEWLIHQLALQWMAPPAAATASSAAAAQPKPRRRGISARYVRELFTRGTDLQLLCAMAGLPVLSSTAAHMPLMAKCLHAAVRLYAEQNPHVFASEHGHEVLWEGEDCPAMTETTRAATTRAVQEATRQVHARRPDASTSPSDICISPSDIYITASAAGPPPPYSEPAMAEATAQSTSPGIAAAPSRPISPFLLQLPAGCRADSLAVPLDPAAAVPPVGLLPPMAPMESALHDALIPSWPDLALDDPAVHRADAGRPAPLAAGASSSLAPHDAIDPELHPESATSIAELLCHHAHAERRWLHHALQAAAGSKKRPLKTTAVKRRLICAAAMALEMHDLTNAQLRGIKVPYSMEALVAVDSHIRVPPGHGLFCPRLYDVIQSYGWPRPAQNVDVEDIDLANRALLRAVRAADRPTRAHILDALRALSALPRQSYTAVEHALPAGAPSNGPLGPAPEASPMLSLSLPLSPNRFDALMLQSEAAAAEPEECLRPPPMTPPAAAAAPAAPDAGSAPRRSNRRSVPALGVVEALAAALHAREITGGNSPSSLPVTPVAPWADAEARSAEAPGPQRPLAEVGPPSPPPLPVISGAVEDNAERNGPAHSTTVQRGLVSADSQPEILPAQCHTVSAALPAGALLQLQRVEYVPVSGLHNQCFYNAVARHFSVYPHELLPVIQDTLTSIDDPVTLARYGLSVEFDADAAAVAAAKQIYLQSADTQSGAWGGSLEMCLLSHARGGAIAFLVVDFARKRTLYYGSLPQGDPAIRTEIALHHCRTDGADQPRLPPNHWATFHYHMNDGSTRFAWSQPHTESDGDKARRVRLLHQTAAQADWQARTRARCAAQVSAQAALQLDRELNGPDTISSSASSAGSLPAERARTGTGYRGRGRRGGRGHGRRGGRNDNRCGPHGLEHGRSVQLPAADTAALLRPAVPPMRRSGASGAPSAGAVVSPPRFSPAARRLRFGSPSALVQSRLHLTEAGFSPAHLRPQQPPSRPERGAIASAGEPRNWKRYRVNTHREIHGRPNELYCQTASRLCEAYLRVASAAQPERGRQAQVAGFFMDYAGRALFRGHRIGAKRKCALMEALGERVLHEVDEALSLPLRQPTATATADAEATAPAALRPTSAIAHEPIDLVSDSDSAIRPAEPPTHPPRAHAQPPDDAAADPESAMLACVRKAAFVIAQGGPHSIQRAARALSAAPLAPLHAGTVTKLREQHPTASEPMGDLPDHAVGIADVDPARLDAVLRRRVHNGSAPGLSGTTGSHLLALWDKASPDGKLGFQLLIRDICNGVFDGELKQRLLACVLVPLAKKDNGVRPVAVAEVLVRCAAHYCMSLIEDDMRSFFPAIQFGVKLAGGSEAAAQLTRAELAYAATKHADVIALKIDFKNAFNAISRARVWDALLAHPKAAPILKAFHWQYSEASPLLVYESGRLFAELRSSNGVRQGCPFAAFAFALTVQPLYEASLRGSPDCRGFSIQDDFTIVGPSAQVLRSFDYLQAHAQMEFELELVTAKCQVFLPPTVAPSRVQAIHEQCAQRHLAHSTEMESLGVMFGPDASVMRHCQQAVDASAHFFACVSHPAMPTQTAALLLRFCAIPKLGYLARTTRPELLLEPARRFDQMALQAQLTILQQTEASLTALQPRVGDPDSTIHDPGDGDPPPGSQPHVSTGRVTAVSKEQLLQRMALPLSLGGLGLRAVESVRHAAYFASLQQILPYFAQLHPELCKNPAAFKRTELYLELKHCQSELVKAGAANEFDLSGDGMPLDAPDAPSPPPTPAAAPACPTAACPPAASAGAAYRSARIPTARRTASRFPSPSLALTQSIDDTWQRAARSAHSTGAHPFSALKLQSDLTRSLEATAWLRLFNGCGRYQQATLTSLSMNPSTSAWLSMPPLTSEPGYRLRDEDYRLAIRHRLGQLPFDSLRDELCIGCARRNAETPSLLADPDHAHSCSLQQGVSVKQRHDSVKQVLAELARSCGFHVEVEPRFPATVETRFDAATGAHVQSVTKPLAHGDLLLVRGNSRQLIDVTVVRPTTLTLLRGPARTGAHLQPLVAAAAAEKRKHDSYDAECAKHGWKLVPFALESLGAKGSEAAQLLQRMAAHAIGRDPAAFLAHADRMLSAALQAGNAAVSTQGAAGLLLHAYRRGEGHASAVSRGPGRHQQRRSARELRERPDAGLGAIVHADYRCARVGVRGPQLAA